MTARLILSLSILTLFITACGATPPPEPTLDINLAITQAFATVHAAYTQTALAVPTSTPLPTETPTPAGPTQFAPSVTLPVTIVSTANCRFGPDTIYAWPVRLRFGKVFEAIGRDESGQWLRVREPGGQNSCWLNIITVNVQGDVNTLDIAPVDLPINPAYPAPPNVVANRVGEWVQIRWGEVGLPPTVIYPESRYLLDLWLCQNGQLVHAPLATNDLSASVWDQPGCAEASSGVIHTTTLEGYSPPAIIPWP